MRSIIFVLLFSGAALVGRERQAAHLLHLPNGADDFHGQLRADRQLQRLQEGRRPLYTPISFVAALSCNNFSTFSSYQRHILSWTESSISLVGIIVMPKN
jgi:hypothetical protein